MIDIESNTFCGAPWFQCRNTNQTEYRACCEIDHTQSEFGGQTQYRFPKHNVMQWLNSDYMKYLRQNLSEGKKLKECQACWNREDKQQISERLSVNKKIFEQNGLSKNFIRNYFKNKKTFEFDLLLIADIKISNVCNYSCMMCGPEDSSQLYTQWLQDKNQWFVKDEINKNPTYFEQIKTAFIDVNNRDLLKSLLSLRPKIIKLLGGEPLMDTESIDLLSNVSIEQQKQTALHIITNGSKDLSLVKAKLQNYKNLTYTISLEGTDTVQELIRKGSNWANIEQNIDNYVKNYGTQDISIHTTVQALTLLHFNKLLDWATTKNIRTTFLILTDPDYLSLQAVPETLIKQSIIKLSQYPGQEIQNLITYLKSIKHDPDKTVKLQQFANWHNNTWLTVFPEWGNH